MREGFAFLIRLCYNKNWFVIFISKEIEKRKDRLYEQIFI